MLRAAVVVAACGAALAAVSAAPSAPQSRGAPAKCLGYVNLEYAEVGYDARQVGRRVGLRPLIGAGTIAACDDTPCSPGEPCPPPRFASAVRRLRGISARVAVAARWNGSWRLFVATDRCAARTPARVLRCLRETE